MTPRQQKLREQYSKALENSNVRQLLNGIGHTESGNRYNVRYSGERQGAKIDMSKPGGHPGIAAPRKDGRKSTAAGRYMFTKPTWDDAAAKLGLDNFNDPKQQDLAAAWLLDQTKSGGKTGLQHALAGDMTQAAKAGASRWEAIEKIGPQKFANNLSSYRNVELGTPTTDKQFATAPPATSGQPVVPPSDTARLGRIGTAQGEGVQYGPQREGDFAYVTQPNIQAGEIGNFQQAMRDAHASVDQRLIPGTPESLTVNPLRRMMHDLGWKLGPAPGSQASLGFSKAMSEGTTPQDWEKNMREFFGVSKTSPVMDKFMQADSGVRAPVETRNLQQNLNGVQTFPVQNQGQTWQEALNPLSDARKEANDLVFGASMPEQNWPTGLNSAIDNAITENWNRG